MARIKTVAAANRYLRERFVPDYNGRFAVPAAGRTLMLAAFAADKPPGVRLLLKSSGPTPHGCDVAAIVQTLGLGERVLMTDAFGMTDTLDVEYELPVQCG